MLSVISIYKNRRHHIEQTWPTWSIQTNNQYEIIIVDYNTDDDLSTFFSKFKHPITTKHLRCDGVSGFSISHARNIGSKVATNDWLCFIDIDTFMDFNFVEWIIERINNTKDCFYLAAEDSGVRKDIINGGLIVVNKKDHSRIFGFNENLQGWGYEDIDYKIRLEKLGLWRIHIPNSIYSCINHPDSERTQCHTIEKEKSWTANRQISLRTWDQPDYGSFSGKITNYKD